MNLIDANIGYSERIRTGNEPRARKRLILYQARENVCESSHDCFVFCRLIAKKHCLLREQTMGIQKETGKTTFPANLLISFFSHDRSLM